MNPKHTIRSSRRNDGRPDSPIVRKGVLAIVLCACILSSACRKTETCFEVIAFADEDNPERISENFEPGSFAMDARGQWDIVFAISPTQAYPSDMGSIETAPETSDGDSPDAAADVPEHGEEDLWWSQTIHIHLFWKPRPGRTYAESSQTNATIVYCIMTNYGIVKYEGAGFVYFKHSRDGKKITGKIESSTLYPSHFVGEPADVFGRCRLDGTFTALEDRRAVVEVQRKLRKRLGRPTMTPPVEIKP